MIGQAFEEVEHHVGLDAANLGKERGGISTDAEPADAVARLAQVVLHHLHRVENLMVGFDIGMIVRKMERFPELEMARRWLELRCEGALKTWTHERVSTLINNPEFQQQVHALTEAMTIPRNIEVVITILLLGRILDIDTRGVIENYASAKEHLSQKTEVYKDVLADCRERAREWNERPRNWVAAGIIVLLWLALLALGTFWLVGRFRRAGTGRTGGPP